MVEIRVDYEGELRCRATHAPSGTELLTDAPVDNQGRGESFSPTDLVATALATCMATIMGIYAQKHGIDLAGTSVRIEKEMGTDPRRIVRMPILIRVPADLDARHRKGLEAAAMHCPVHQSIHPGIETPVELHFGAE